MFKAIRPALLGLVLVTATLPASSAVEEFNPKSESIFVLRVRNAPANLGLMVFDGKPGRGTAFRFSMFTPPRFRGLAVDGYLVGRSKNGEWLALSSVGGNNTCKDGSTLAFRVPAGKVGYVGDVVIQPKGTGFVASAPTQDLPSAQAFMRQHHAQWAEQMESLPSEVRTVNSKCRTGYEQTVIHIPI